MDRRSHLSDLFHQALERPPAERDAFLEQACAGNADLRREVESLLRYESASARFLESPAAVDAAADGCSGGERLVRPGCRLGPYTIIERLGIGGMGEVYRARDNRLGRDVAVKMLPDHFTRDNERRARFAREARVLATINHPNVGAIYGIEEAEGLTALVLELVEGPTLSDRLARGRLPIREALSIARQIGDGLRAAHERGIVHRDLKPANVVLDGRDMPGHPSGSPRVKVLDFGLAKLLRTTDPDSRDAASMASSDTAEGRILGTPAYMSPEQARGLPVDKRTDVWAFGCVVFEMLAGSRPFDGDTATDTLARVLERDPEWSRLPPMTPPPVRRMLLRCLRKDQGERLHDIADALIELHDVETHQVADGAARSGRARRTRWEGAAWIVAGASTLAAVALGVLHLRGGTPPPPSLEFPLFPPTGWSLAPDVPAPRFEVSPDGQSVVVPVFSQGVSRLWIRPIASPAWRQLPGTEHASAPFWSPDSESVAFFADDHLKSVRVSAGEPVVLAEATSGPPVGGGVVSGAWSRNGVILIGGRRALASVPATGGSATPVTTLREGETGHSAPSFLPDGDHYLYLALTESSGELRLASLTSGQTASLGPAESHAAYASGHIVFVRDGRLMAQPFDVRARRTAGDALVVAENAAVVPPNREGRFSASAVGVLAYSGVAWPAAALTWLNREGRPLETVGDPGVYLNLDLSPDETLVAVSRFVDPPQGRWNVDIWTIDLTRNGLTTRLTTDAARDFDPAFSPDGRRIAFNSSRVGGRFRLFTRPSTAEGETEALAAAGLDTAAPGWSPPDGRVLVYTTSGDGTLQDLWTVAVAGDAAPTPFLQTPFRERSAEFSPDGRWVAYVSDMSGRNEVHVRPFPPREGHALVSRNGGYAPRWRADGRELFFLAPDGTMMAADIVSLTPFRAPVPRPLFKTAFAGTPYNRPYVVSRDGQRFLLPIPLQSAEPAPLTVIMNWPARLRQQRGIRP